MSSYREPLSLPSQFWERAGDLSCTLTGSPYGARLATRQEGTAVPPPPQTHSLTQIYIHKTHDDLNDTSYLYTHTQPRNCEQRHTTMGRAFILMHIHHPLH